MSASVFYGASGYLYPDFIDVATGKTLVVQAGSSYTVAPASGRLAALPALPGDGRWVKSSGVGLEAAPPDKEPLKIPAPAKKPDKPEGEAE